MLNITLKDKKYTIPETTSELTFETGVEILEYLILEKNRDFIKELSIISKIPYVDLLEVDEAQLLLLHSQILYLNGLWILLADEDINELTINNKKYNIKTFNDLTLREYGEITTYWDLDETPLENLAEIVSILYTGDESISNDLREHCSFIFFYTIMNKVSLFMKWINSYYFQIDDEDKERTEREEVEDKEDEPKNGKSEWGLYEVLYNITDGDIQKMDYWLNKNVLEFMKYCRFRIYNNRKIQHG